MFYVYVLWSESKQKTYLGYSSNLKKRLENHNQGHTISTRSGRPWEIIYYESYKSSDLAKEREAKLKKRGKLWQALRNRILIK